MGKVTKRASKMVRPNDKQIGGNHYRGKGGCPYCGKELQHWDIAWSFGFDFFQYIITKWVFRWKDKGGVEDLHKARHAIDKYISLVAEEDDGSAPTRRYVDQG
jgi:hypothetical protein